MTQKDQWDETLRGPKMSDASGEVIFKYQMPVKERFTMLIPSGAEIIRMEDQDGMFWLWAIVNTTHMDEELTFHSVKCGGKMPEVEGRLVYRGFCRIFIQQELGLYIFEEVK